MTSLVIERFGMGATSRLQRAIADVDERIGLIREVTAEYGNVRAEIGRASCRERV